MNIGVAGSFVFYDAMLSSVAREDEMPAMQRLAEEYAESRWKAERLLRVFDGPTTESARPARAPSTPTP